MAGPFTGRVRRPGGRRGWGEIENYRAEGYVVRFTKMRGLTHPKVLTKVLRFPNGPIENIRYGDAYSHSEYQTLRLGTLSRPQGHELRTVSFSTLVTDWPLSVASFPDDLHDPLGFIYHLRKIQAAGTPFWLEMGLPTYNEEWDLAMPATLRSVDAEERAGEPDTRYIDVSLVEFRDADVKGRKKGKGSGGAQGHWGKLPATVVILEDGGVKGGFVKKPVTLYKLASYYYGSAAAWRHVRGANQSELLKGISPGESIAAHVKKKQGGKWKRPYKLKVPLVKTKFDDGNASFDDTTTGIHI